VPDLSSFLARGEELAAAMDEGRPVLALESTIISHGMPFPRNLETALATQQAVRDAGAVPATIAIMNGKLRVGISDAEIALLARQGQEATKCSRRDIPFVLENGAMGATTVAATMIIAAMAGIQVFATGGIGGVHRGSETSMDISADLLELSRTSVAVVCAGPKSILDIGLTLEYLETHGVPVIGFGTDELPAFYTRQSGHTVDYRLDTPRAIAAALNTKWAVGLEGGAVIANPVPSEYAMASDDLERLIAKALDDASEQRIAGKELTPYLLSRIESLTDGDSLETNIQLMLNNARLGAQIAVALNKHQL
jgi:pseudouridine-5'-phosphate glycosidase